MSKFNSYFFQNFLKKGFALTPLLLFSLAEPILLCCLNAQLNYLRIIHFYEITNITQIVLCYLLAAVLYEKKRYGAGNRKKVLQCTLLTPDLRSRQYLSLYEPV